MTTRKKQASREIKRRTKELSKLVPDFMSIHLGDGARVWIVPGLFGRKLFYQWAGTPVRVVHKDYTTAVMVLERWDFIMAEARRIVEEREAKKAAYLQGLDDRLERALKTAP